MKTAAAILLLVSCWCAPAAACDKVDAAKVQLALSEMGAQWSEHDGRVVLEWGWEWDSAGRAHRLELLRAFASGDACLNGGLREITFYRKGQVVGLASPAGVHLVGETATAQANTRSPARPESAACPN